MNSACGSTGIDPVWTPLLIVCIHFVQARPLDPTNIYVAEIPVEYWLYEGKDIVTSLRWTHTGRQGKHSTVGVKHQVRARS